MSRSFVGCAAALLCLLAAACGGGGNPPHGDTGPEAPVCGDGVCESDAGERPQSCPADCRTTILPSCGDGSCNGDETRATCTQDCPCTCDEGTTCASPTDDTCVCDDVGDGICPAGCASDPDCNTCVPSCDGVECGPDGCGGACGTCAAGESCSDAGQCAAACVPACDGKQCGPDGCGGTCGSCGAGTACVASMCEALDPRCGGLDPEVCSALSWGSCASDWVWRTPFSQVGGALLSLEASDERIWIAGDQAFFAFHDGAYLHKVANPHAAAWLADIWRSPEGRWWAVGENGRIFLGDGECWAAVPTPVTANLHAVWGSADDDVWAVGSNGIVLRFDGSAWKRITLPASITGGWSGTLRDVWGAGRHVWIVGSGSLIAHFDGTRWERHEMLWTHEFHRVFVRSATDVWALASTGWWIHWNGAEWNSELRPELLLDMWGRGDEVWRTWAHSGSGTGGLEHSSDGGATYTPVGGLFELVYSPRLAFGGELWSLMPGRFGSRDTTDLVRVVNDEVVASGDPTLLAMREITVLHRLPGGTTIATNYDTLFTHDGSGWSTETLPTEMQGLYLKYAATRGDEIWLANGWRPGGPHLAHFTDGAWSVMSLDGVAFELAGLACTGADCFVASGSSGVLRWDGAAWVRDTLPGIVEGGIVIRIAANATDVWIGVNLDGSARVYRRGPTEWIEVASGLQPVKGLAVVGTQIWSLGMNGRLSAFTDNTGTTVGDLPQLSGGRTLQWHDLRFGGDTLYAVADGVVCTTSTIAGESFGYECLASPFTGGFNGIGAGPGGMWMLAGSSGFLELR